MKTEDKDSAEAGPGLGADAAPQEKVGRKARSEQTNKSAPMMAEGAGFEPAWAFTLTHFKCAPL